MRGAARGFTLLEILMAAAIGLVIVTSALSFLVALDRAHARRARLAELRRTTARVMDQLSSELRQAGLGIPVGSSLEAAGRFPSRRLIEGTATSVGFLVDLPRPDGTFNGVSMLADDQLTGMPASSLAVLNELSGDCDVSLGTVHCETGLSTLLFAPLAGGCHLAPNAPTCPWGLNRYRPGEQVLVSDASGRWVERVVGAGLSTASATRRALELTPSAPPAPLLARARGGFASTVDRVFYRQNAGLLERHQCWGVIGAPTLVSLGPCIGGAGTAWEQLAPLPLASAFTLSYFDGDGVALGVPVAAGALPTVARVDVVLHLEVRFGDELLTSDSNQSVAFRQ